MRSFAVVFSHKPIVFRATRPCKARHTQREKQRAKAKCHERMEKGQDTARTGFLAVICMYSCVRMCIRTVWFQDALSNVLFISVEQSLPVYPEDISLVALCTQRNSASQSREPHLKRPLKITVASKLL